MTHLISRVSAVVAALALMAVAALAGLWGLDAPRSEANHAGGMTAISVDVNIGGNDADTLGLNNTCVSATAGTNITVDVTALEIPVSNPIVGYGFSLAYDASYFIVEEADPYYLLDVLPGSSLIVGTLPPPDTDGDYTAGVADISATAREYGSGVLERLVLSIDAGTPAGEYALTLSNAAHIGPDGMATPPDSFRQATVAVDQPCPIGIGDVDCSGAVNSIDALKILRHNASLQVSQTEPCTDLGQSTGSRDQGDVDCNNAVNAIDALKVLRGVAGLAVQQEPGCPSVI
jgi:hypothetical protein